jgi:UDPglucose 6-dehydrogenase
VIRGLLDRGARVVAHDPEAMPEAKRIFGEAISVVESPYEACTGADVLMVLTEWSTYQRPNFETIKRLLKSPLIVDGRNIYNPERMRQAGFVYHSIGRATTRP